MAGFMAGFGTKFSELIEEDRKYYRDRAAKRQDYLQTYGTRAVAEREDKANAALGVANTLINRGFSKDYVTSIAANNGVRSMVDFADQISKRTDLTETDIKEIEASAKDFVKDNPDEDLSTVVKRAYGLYKSTKDPVARKRNIFGAMLGLDASMMEDDVLNDMYIDGYTGRDIYRIMGSAGPGAGKPMGVKLPPKAHSYKENLAYRAAISQEADNFIAYELEELGQRIDKTPDSEVKQTLQGIRTELLRIQEDLKTDPSGAMAEYLGMSGLSYNSSLLGTIQQTEDAYVGAITRNPLLTDVFKTTYGQLVGDIKDDTAASADKTKTAGTQAPIVTTEVKQPPKNATVTDTGIIKFETVADRDAAVEAGTIPINAKVQVGDGSIDTFTPPPSYEPVDTSMTDTSSLEGVAGASGVSVAELVEPKPELTVEERVQAKRDAAQGVIDAVDSNVSSFTQRLDQGFASGAMTTNAYGNTILGGVAQTVGANDLADFFYTQAVKSEDGAETTEGLIPAINNLLDEFGVPDYSETDDPQVALDKAVEFVLSALPQDEKYDAALDRAPDHIEKLGDQATDAWRKLTAAVKDFSLSDVSLTTADEDNPMLKVVQAIAPVTEAETDEPEETMEDRIRDDARQFLQDRKSFPQPLPRIVIDTLTDDIVEEAKVNKEVSRVVQQLDQKGGVPSRKTIEDLKTTLELNQVIDTETQELYRGPISGKTLVEKLDDLVNPAIDFVRGKNAEAFRKAEARRGRGILERDSVNLEDSPGLSFLAAENEPSAMTRTRAPLGDTRTEPDATVPSISAVDTSARPSGLMSPDKDTRKVNVGDLATFADPQLMNNIETAHGSGSKTFKDFEKKISSGTMKPADITRLIKATRKLPKTTSRGKLLDSLFELRDSLNNR